MLVRLLNILAAKFTIPETRLLKLAQNLSVFGDLVIWGC